MKLALAGILAGVFTISIHGETTFYANIAPIVYRNCAPCHHAGGPGPFPLVTYEDVRKHARQIADVTRRRYMPPWFPSRAMEISPMSAGSVTRRFAPSRTG